MEYAFYVIVLLYIASASKSFMKEMPQCGTKYAGSASTNII
jgi:hypothetical protein